MFARKPIYTPPTHRLRLLAPPLMRRENRTDNEALIRARCITAYLGESTALCRILGRYKLFVDTQDAGLSVHLMLDGYWEMWLTEVLAEFVKPGMVVADIGANLGYFSMLLADLVGDRGRVHAIEPNAALAQRLRKSARANGYERIIEISEDALGDVDGGLFHFVIPPTDPKNGHLIPIEFAPLADAAELIGTRRLDGFPALMDVDIVKIDADTAERAIWRGMRGIFDRGRPMTVFLEFTAERYADTGAGAFVDEITAEGFTIARVDPAEGVIEWSKEAILAFPANEDQILILRR
ncbi:FkbM family methyltransferase [Sphingomonas bacterium]|uniref:FkbM family methyltransferase n=1 Tax=Sphingomonas bacterium TaxID=1895847 RepID=UPI001C2DD611|nr:FkbM family methyltransferase [Sphingomonas bacterium]